VAEKTREAILLCEAGGYGVIIVETVGVGQSEVAVAGMVDMFILLQLPHAGDELQALKKGIIELADLVVITRRTSMYVRRNSRARKCRTSSLCSLRPLRTGRRRAAVSALTGAGVAELWQEVTRFEAR